MLFQNIIQRSQKWNCLEEQLKTDKNVGWAEVLEQWSSYGVITNRAL